MELKNLEKNLDKGLFAKLKKLFSNEPEKPEEAPVELGTEALADGSGSIKGKIAEGETVMWVGADGAEAPVPDGEYKLASGKIVTCAGGKITAVKDAPAADDTLMSEEKVQKAIQEALSSQKADFEKQVKEMKAEHEAALKKTNEKFSAVLEVIEMMAKDGTPAPAPKDDPKGKHAEARKANFSKMLDRIASITKEDKK